MMLVDSSLAMIARPDAREHYESTGELLSFNYISEDLMRLILLIPWPAFILSSGFIGLLYLMSGGLHCWPQLFNRISMHRTIHFTFKKIILEDIKLARSTVVTVSVTAFCTFLISRLF